MCMEFAVGSGIPDSLWVRIKGYINNADVIVGACNGPCSQHNDTDELFFEKVREASKSPALVLMLQLARF